MREFIKNIYYLIFIVLLNKWDIVNYKKLELIFIIVPKTANSSINSVILKKLWIDTKNNKYLEIHKKRREFRISKKEAILDKYSYKFSFVRNPFDRIVSCYENKIIKEDHRMQKWYFWLLYKGMSFKDFVKSINKIPDFLSDLHFRSQYSIIYNKWKKIVNYIWLFENIEQDFNYIRKKYKFEKLPTINKSLNKKYRGDYYDQETINIIYKRYKKDFETWYPKEKEKLNNYIKSN